MSSSLFGDGRPMTISQMVEKNDGVILSIIVGAFLGILKQIQQPYEILLCVLLALLISIILMRVIRRYADQSMDAGLGWRISMLSYIDYYQLAIIMFTTEYVTSVATSEWEKVSYGTTDTVIVGLVGIILAIGFLVLITDRSRKLALVHPHTHTE
jgi:uncharacterized membrane protein